MKIGFVSFAYPKLYAEQVELGTQLRREYCIKQGYELFEDVDDVFDSSRPAAWSKLDLLLKHMDRNKFDWLFWNDADTILKNKDIKLQDLFKSSGVNDKHDFVITRDGRGYINTGNFFVRVSNYAKDFLNKLKKMTFFNDCRWYEQAAFVYLYRRNYKYIADKTHIEHRPWKFNSQPIELWTNEVADKLGMGSKFRHFNSYSKPLENSIYRTGDFLIHFAGAGKDLLKDWMQLASNQNYDYFPPRACKEKENESNKPWGGDRLVYLPLEYKKYFPKRQLNLNLFLEE